MSTHLAFIWYSYKPQREKTVLSCSLALGSVSAPKWFLGTPPYTTDVTRPEPFEENGGIRDLTQYYFLSARCFLNPLIEHRPREV